MWVLFHALPPQCMYSHVVHQQQNLVCISWYNLKVDKSLSFMKNVKPNYSTLSLSIQYCTFLFFLEFLFVVDFFQRDFDLRIMHVIVHCFTNSQSMKCLKMVTFWSNVLSCPRSPGKSEVTKVTRKQSCFFLKIKNKKK